MTRLCTATLSAFMLMPSLAGASLSDFNCDDSARMVSMLSDVLGAERHGSGLRDPETMLEVWIAPRSSDWIIVQNYANGTSCIVAMGEHWQDSVTGPA
ncbi:MAG: hypothetical protein AAFO58_04520 [Pseudomonadota bacterium]